MINYLKKTILNQVDVVAVAVGGGGLDVVGVTVERLNFIIMFRIERRAPASTQHAESYDRRILDLNKLLPEAAEGDKDATDGLKPFLVFKINIRFVSNVNGHLTLVNSFLPNEKSAFDV